MHGWLWLADLIVDMGGGIEEQPTVSAGLANNNTGLCKAGSGWPIQSLARVGANRSSQQLSAGLAYNNTGLCKAGSGQLIQSLAQVGCRGAASSCWLG